MRSLWWFRPRRDPSCGNFIDNPSMCMSEDTWRAANGFTEADAPTPAARRVYPAPDHVRFTDALEEWTRVASHYTLAPGPEPGSDAHRVYAIADEELRAWDEFIAGLQAKNRKVGR